MGGFIRESRRVLPFFTDTTNSKTLKMITLKNESQLKSFIKRTYLADKDGVLLLWGREQYRSEFSCILVDGKKVIRQSIIMREIWDDDCYVSYEEKTCNQLIALYIPRKKPNRSQL